MKTPHNILILLTFLTFATAACGGKNDAKFLGDKELLTHSVSTPSITHEVTELPYPTTEQTYVDIFKYLENQSIISNTNRLTINDLRSKTEYKKKEGKALSLTKEASDRRSGKCSEAHTDLTHSLPENKKIYGFVTYRPAHYKKIDICGSDRKKYYGGFWIQDDTGGIYVLRDGKTIPFNVGDLVSIQVDGSKDSYGTKMVVLYKDISKVTDSNGKPITLNSFPGRNGALYSQKVSATDADQHYGEVITIEDLMIKEPPTNYNFNTITTNNGISISLDNKWLQGNPFEKPFKKNKKITVSGPIEKNYGSTTIFVGSNKQIEFKD